jgi:hypothetical protein
MPSQRVERRSPRTPSRRAASINVGDGSPDRPCVMWDMSDKGAKLATVRPLLLPERFTLVLSATLHRRCQVMWRSEKFVGVQFIDA